MRHVSLYRKWRPRTFDAVAGQEPVVRTLKRAVETRRVAHAYLFSGPRGTGKTSTAKVLAMGLNCELGPTAEPDGTCASCRAIVNNSSMDVLEMDAASNRGIDEIRDLRDKVNLAPVAARTKVYIIDEVHMLTTEAFNALLKMLEEPPEQVVFVLATTEKHKVPPTIVSRCQSFDFRRPSVALLSEKLREIAAAEGIEAEPEALTIVAREGRGSFRDAEGLLDQLASFADGPVTAGQVRELLGSTGSEVLLETTDALYERRTADALRSLDRLSNEGKDLSQFAGELVAHLRRLMLLPDAPEVALAEVGAEERAGLEEQAGRVPTAQVVRMIESLGATISRAKRGGDPKLELELTFLKLARDYEEPPVEAIMARLEALEKAVKNGATNAAVPPASRTEPAVKDASEPEEAGEEAEVVPEAYGSGAGELEVLEAGYSEPGGGNEDEYETWPEVGGEPAGTGGEGVAKTEPRDGGGGVVVLAAQWEEIMRDLKERKQASAEAVFRSARPVSFADNVLEIEFPQEQASLLSLARQPKHVDEMRKVLEGRLGFRIGLGFKIAGESGPVIASEAPREESTTAARTEPPNPRPDPESIVEAAPERSEERALGPLAGGPPEQEADDVPDGGGSDGADGTIQSQLEVFEMFREWSGGPGGKQNGGV
jgi:DNA polymerase-3 subunit gamma/tau